MFDVNLKKKKRERKKVCLFFNECPFEALTWNHIILLPPKSRFTEIWFGNTYHIPNVLDDEVYGWSFQSYKRKISSDMNGDKLWDLFVWSDLSPKLFCVSLRIFKILSSICDLCNLKQWKFQLYSAISFLF